MKTIIKKTIVLCCFILSLSIFSAHAINFTFTACQNGTAAIADSNAITGLGSWSALPGNPSVVSIDSPTSFSMHVTGLSLPGTYWLVWTGTGVSDTVDLEVQASPSAPVLSQLGICLGSDSLLLSGIPGAREIDWSLSGTNVHTTLYPSHTAACGNSSGPALNQFNYNGSIALDGAGNLYVADWGNTRIMKFPPGSNSTTLGVVLAGGNGNGNAADQFRGPAAVYVDAAGYIYVSDYYNNRVQQFPSGSTSATNGVTIAGGNGSGSAANQLQDAWGITGDAAGNIYVADGSNNRVQMFPAGSTSATNGITVAGGNGSGSAANQLNSPISVVVDASGNLYVSDEMNDRIQKFPAGSTSATNGITVAGGNGHGAGTNQLSYPSGISLNAANELYVLDYGNFRVQKFPAGSTSATNGVTVAGGNGPGSAINQMGVGLGIAVDANDDIFVFDADNYRVQEYTGTGINPVYTPTQLGYYTASIIVDHGCPYPLSDSVLVSICTPDTTVWPGDADANHLVDNIDLLPIGLGYDSTGSARTVQTIVWQADIAMDWADTLPGYSPTVNFKHADCNGDGIINAADTSAILTNFGDVHAKTNGYNSSWRSGIPALKVYLYNDTTYAGDTLTAKFYLGDSAIPVSNIYGLAFTYNYDPLVIDSTTFSFGFINSWLGNSSNSINIQKNFAASGTLKVAITGINHLPRSGSGQIATSRGVITTDNINAKTYSYYTNTAYISDITAIDQLGNPVPLNAGIDSSQIGYYPNGIREPSGIAKVSVYPNPASTQVRISTDVNITGITITDMLGQEVIAQNVSGKQSETIDISVLAVGVYTIHVSTADSTGTARLVVSR